MKLQEISRRGLLADSEFENYEFPEGVVVVDHDNWNTDDVNDFTKIVYISADDDMPDSDTEKVSFHVRFDGEGVVSEAYGLLMRSGSDIGVPAL